MASRNGKILIIDDNQELLFALKLFLDPHFECIDTLKNPNQIVSTVERNNYDLVLLDMNFKAGVNTGNEGLYWLHRILEQDPQACVVLITAFGDVELAVKAMKEGAADFIQKSWDENKILSTLLSAYQRRKSNLEIKSLKDKQRHLDNQLNRSYDLVIGSSPAMQQVLETVRKVAQTDANVLILGENGTGKELIAREIHYLSNRSEQVFVGVDVGSLSETLFESELFGYKKGAFTDAREDRVGRFEIASGGSLFLDEIGNIPLHLQAKLLAVLQNREVVPLGGVRPVPVDIRLISATNSDVVRMVGEGRFREDLLYRINTIQVEVPPLRQRKEDIPVLARFFLEKYAERYQRENMRLQPSALKKLIAHNWQGNVRELQHVMEKTVILAGRSLLEDQDILISNGKRFDVIDPASFNIADNERILIQRAMEHCGGNLSLTAKKLGINRSTLYDKLKKYDL